MSALSKPRRRKRRSDIESDDDADTVRGSQRQSSSSSADSPKRARTNGYQSDIQSDLEQEPTANGNRMYEEEDEDEDEDLNEFQPGAIVRVKLTNFVTYESAEFFPGPSLNMVIGPNGTGKSSLVCAICLGLGWGPRHLGRAGEVGEFVKHHMSQAEIEIELYRKPTERNNSVIRLRITREGNARDWWIDGKKSSMTAVKELVSDFRIQVDNLCQFLPQEKVSEFAGLSPVDLLLHTQRAAAPEQMREWHEELKKLRGLQKIEEIQKKENEDKLANCEARLQNLDAEVQRLQERNEITQRVNILRKTIPFVEYTTAVAQHKEFKQKKIEAQKRFQELERSIQPILQSTLEKESYRDKIEEVAKQRKAALRIAESDAERLTARFDSLEEEIKELETTTESEAQGEKKLKVAIQTSQRRITEHKARYNTEPPAFDSVAFNERIRAKEQEDRHLKSEMSDCDSRYEEFKVVGRINRKNHDEAKQELAEFDSQEGQLMSKLEKTNAQVARAWKWVQQNQNLFEKEIYGPPLVTCSIKDPRYGAAVESAIRESDALAITAQCLNDFKLLSNKIHGELGLHNVPMRTAEQPVQEARLLTRDEMQQYGMDGWAIDYVDGPGPVLSMLIDAARLDQCAVTLQDISDSQYQRILQGDKLSTWVTGSSTVNVSRRREYGPNAVSTASRALKKPTIWTDQPVDASERRDIQSKIDILETEFRELKQEVEKIRQEKGDLKTRQSDLEDEIKKIKEEKDTLQTAYNAWRGLPSKIEVEEDAIKERKGQILEIRKTVRRLSDEHDKAILRKSKTALQYKDQVAIIRTCHEELLEAQIRLIEAESDVAGLKERNSDIVQRRDEEKQKVKEAEQESLRVKAVARKAQEVCVAIIDDPECQDFKEQLTNPPEGVTVESLHNDISAEESKLDYIVANNPNAIQQWEGFDAQAKDYRKKLDAIEEKLAKIDRRITKIRGKWEPELDILVSRISEAFSYNFEQIGCAGEVCVHKDEEFEKWAIQIKVKFRENETLQLLDAQRQSGGERSVSTIFYLMSLQALAQAPFRVVDEINQGMDPRNERMVHERMVEIACKEHTSQYFLITPKLLTGLRYDKRMKVLCIASGEHMPDNYKKLDISKIIGIRKAIMAVG